MSYYNPNNKAVLYFHIVERDNDYYLRVDVINKRVFKLCYKETRIQGSWYLSGLYELRWTSFLSKYCWDLKKENFQWVKQCEARDGHKRGRVIYTTQNQFNKAFVKLLTNIEGPL